MPESRFPEQLPEEHPSPRGEKASALAPAGGAVLPQVVYVQGGGRQTVLWVIAVLWAVIATALIARLDESVLPSAAAQVANTPGATGMAGGRGIYAFTGQLDAKDYGVFMLDVDTGTLWCYQMIRGRDSGLQLQLVAARSWIFDRYLEEFNVAKPTPGEVQMMVRQQRAAAGAPAGPANFNFAPPAPAATNPDGGLALPDNGGNAQQ